MKPAVRTSRPAVGWVLLGMLVLAGCTDSSADADFGDLTSGQRVHDTTGSLDAVDERDVAERLETLQAATGADAVVVVRELDADPEETLEQVEALQQAWVEATGADEDVAVAFLVNREPGSDDEARAGLFVGSRFDDGNVPSGEQEAIVEDALVPPLRDGDVAASLTAGIERLDRSIRLGPPPGPLDGVAEGPGSTWLPWTGLALALLGSAGVLLLERRRPRASVARMSLSTLRPDASTSAPLAAALAGGTPSTRAVPAVVLALAARDALVLEPAPSDADAAQARLLDPRGPADDVERAVWRQLEEQAEGGVVDAEGLATVVADTGPPRDVVKAGLAERGWWNPQANRTVALLSVIGVLALLLTVAGIAVAVAGAPLMLLTAVPAGALTLLAVTCALVHPRLSSSGLDAARPWQAYRDGLKAAAKDESAPLDLDAALPDLVALDLTGRYAKRLEAATEDAADGTTLRAFTAPDGSGPTAILPWAVFQTAFISSAGSGTTVSSGGAGGGGGAAGGT